MKDDESLIKLLVLGFLTFTSADSITVNFRFYKNISVMYKYVWFIKPCKSVKFRPKFDELKLPMFR